MEKNFFQNIFLEKWRPYFWIILIGFLLYFPSLFFDFTYLDDNVLILDNYHLLRNPSYFFQAFNEEVFHLPRHSAYYYRPLQTIGLMLGAQLSGQTPSGFVYHLMNVLFHLLAASLLFFLFLKFDFENFKKELAFSFALIFAVHPVLTQAVAWIPGGVDILLTIFVFGFFINLISFLKIKKGFRRFYFFQLLFLVLALFTKETALALLPVGFLYLLLIEKEKLSSFKAKILLAGWLIVTVAWFILRQFVLGKVIGFSFEDIFKSLIFNLPALIQFVGKIIFPFNLSVLPIIKDTSFIYGFITLSLLALFLFLSKKKRVNLLIFGSAWFLLFLLPTFIRPNPSIVADFIEHRLYLPMFGFFLILSEIDFIKRMNFQKKYFLIVYFSISALFIGLTFFHSLNFKDRMSFWENAAATSSHSPLAQRNLGAMYYLKGNLEEAEKYTKKSLELNSSEPMAHNNLGLIYMQKNRLEESELEFKRELEINPRYDTVHFNLGLLYYRQGKFKEAEDFWKKTLEINPNYIDAYYNLAIYYSQQKDFGRALYYANELRKRGILLPADFFGPEATK